jgi:hypothetical protein
MKINSNPTFEELLEATRVEVIRENARERSAQKHISFWQKISKLIHKIINY